MSRSGEHHNPMGQQMLDARLAQLRASREERQVSIRELCASAAGTVPEVPFRTVTVVDKANAVDLDALQDEL